jgi:predicted nucleic acid-binding protein
MLVDTSIWVEHLRHGQLGLVSLLHRAEVQCHPFIIGELACGSISRRSEILQLLRRLPSVPVVENEEVMTFVERHRLMGRGVGWVDVHLLASAALESVLLWSADRRLAAIARLNCHLQSEQPKPRKRCWSIHTSFRLMSRLCAQTVAEDA